MGVLRSRSHPQPHSCEGQWYTNIWRGSLFFYTRLAIYVYFHSHWSERGNPMVQNRASDVSFCDSWTHSGYTDIALCAFRFRKVRICLNGTHNETVQPRLRGEILTSSSVVQCALSDSCSRSVARITRVYMNFVMPFVPSIVNGKWVWLTRMLVVCAADARKVRWFVLLEKRFSSIRWFVAFDRSLCSRLIWLGDGWGRYLWQIYLK